MTEGSDNFDYIINLDNGRIKEAYNMQGNRGHIDENILTKIVEDLKKQGIDIDTAHNN
jgi:protein-tyrosine-phosphatase